ncbi:hypothetical protein G3260_006737 [Streptomyces albus]|uniref:Uncharacterized protein n=1 Tax=Streptomyces albus TaxID=1888 RepID=A0A6C1CDS9_9ACTN|nr:hypothetical protein G3260_006737 [Streptomyces albus]TGG83806.1 hypothetical protein D8771_13810 [Streptomyces albus]
MIDPDRPEHAHLIKLQRIFFERDAELATYTGDDAEPLREAARQATTEKIAALKESGLIEEHGHFVAGQDLKQATRAAMRG